MAQGYVIIDESGDSDVDESLQYSVNMTPADHAILHSKQWLNDKVYYEKYIWAYSHELVVHFITVHRSLQSTWIS